MLDVFRLVYCSRATAPMDNDELRAILAVARTNNRRDRLTGVLCFARPVFLQCLEGPRGAVNRALGRIHRDPRHQELNILDARFMTARTFPDWSMELVHPARVPADLLARLFDADTHGYGAGRLDTERVLNLMERISAGDAGETAPGGSGARTLAYRTTGA